MADNKEISLKIVADAQAAGKSVDALKVMLKQAQTEAKNLAITGKENTEEYRKARDRVAELQDKMRDFNDELKALDPGQKFQAIGGVASGIAGGIQAATGAMALFGKESEEVQKLLLKVQAASAIAQGIDQVRELGKAFDMAKIAITGGVQTLSKLRVALIATGVGAFAVAAGLIAANWGKVKKAIDDTFPSLGGIGNLFDNMKKVAMGALASIVEGFKVLGDVAANIFSGEFSKAIETAKGFGSRVSQAYTEGYKEEEKVQAMEREAALLESQAKAHERQIKLLEVQGKDVYKLKKKQLEDELRLIEIQKGKETDEYKDKYLELQILEVDHNKKMMAIRDAAIEAQRKRDRMVLDYEASKIVAERQAALDAEKKYLDERDALLMEQIEKETAASNKAFDEEVKRKLEAKKANEDRIADEIATREAIIGIAQGMNQALLGLGNAFIKDQKKLEEFNKKAALIQIGIDTAKAISSAVTYATANPMNSITAGLAGAAQLAATLGVIAMNMARARQILSSSGSSQAPTLGTAMPTNSFASNGMNVNAPQVGNQPGAVVQGQRVANQTGEGANEMGQFKVYVTETDITSTQQRVQTIQNKAKLF
jgi:hypothetical protein